MKKILLATSILAASAGFAAADVAVSGSARMGVTYIGKEINFSSRVRVAFDLTAESDTGLSFGASIRADNAANGNTGNAGSVFIAVGGHKLSMGDVAGATESILGDLYSVGYTGLTDRSDIPYLTGDSVDLDANGTADITAAGNPVALYNFSNGSLHFAASFSDGKLAAADDPEKEMAVAVAYTMGDWTVGLGYETRESAALPSKAKMLELGAAGKVGTANVKAYYADGSGALAGVEAWGLSADTTFGATTVGAFYQDVNSVAAYGIGVSYDLGGGAALKAGIVDADDLADPIADLGITMKF